jgi:hypothetical protein
MEAQTFKTLQINGSAAVLLSEINLAHVVAQTSVLLKSSRESGPAEFAKQV